MNKIQRYPNRKSLRLKGYDYTLPGAYFVTLVTHNRVSHFGKIENGQLILNPTGVLIQERWQRLSGTFAWAEFSDYIIMPNHIHGIIRINQQNISQSDHQKINGTEPRSISAIIQNFKSITSRLVKKRYAIDGLWQRGFHDRIIRDEKELCALHEYILSNPLQWNESDDE